MSQPWIRVVLVAALGCSPCLAQRSALEPPEIGRYVRWGPLRARPGVEISNLGYDDNIFSSTANQVGDYVATVAPKLDGLVLFGDRAFLTFREKLEFTTYLEESDQNFTNQRGTARVTFPLRRMGIFIEGRLDRVKQRPVDQDDLRIDRDEDRLGVGVILAPSWRTEIEIGRSRRDSSYFDPGAALDAVDTVADRLNRTEDIHTLVLRYRLLGRTRFTLDAGYDRIDFDSPLYAVRDSRGWSLQPGVDFGEGGALSGSIRVGWAEIDTAGTEQADLDEVVGRAELAYRPVARTILRLTSKREPAFTVSSDSTFVLNTQVGLQAVYYLSRVIGIEAGGSRGRLEFPVASGGAQREDRLDSYSAGLRFRLAEDSLGRRIEYSLRVRHYRRDSTNNALDRTRTTVGLGAVLGF